MEYMYLAAIDLARRAHKGQLRKYTNEPYIAHPFAVAGLVASVTDNINMIVASILHDVIEDTPVSSATIYGLFNNTVGKLVEDLTDISKPSDGNRTARKLLDLEHTAMATPEVKTIKLADLIDNTKTICAFDKNFARVYMHEMQRLLEVLTEGDSTLYNIANSMTARYFKTGDIV